MPDSYVHFIIDANNQIIGTSEAWNDFARANGGEHLSNPIGKNLWDLIHDDGVRLLYAALFQDIRYTEANKISFTYHCDGPDEKREFRMLLEGNELGEIQISNLLLNKEPNTPEGYLSYTSNPKTIQICPQCLKLKINDLWISVHKALAGAEIMKDNVYFKFERALCDQGHDTMQPPQ